MNQKLILLTASLIALFASCDSSTGSDSEDSSSSVAEVSSSSLESSSSSAAGSSSSVSSSSGISSSSSSLTGSSSSGSVSSSSSATSSSSSVVASSSSAVPDTIIAESHPSVEYALERDPKINRQGIGMDFVHGSSTLDTAFLDSSRSFDSDLILYNVMVYYSSETGDSLSEGCPGILMYTATTGSVEAAKIGKGITFFNAYDRIPPDDIAALQSDPPVDFEALHYGMQSIPKDSLMAVYSTLVIGKSFRATVLVVPDTSTEQEEQPVFLVRTKEGSYAKFMVKQFQGDGADKKKTIVLWQVLKT